MIKIMRRVGTDVSYYLQDPAAELEDIRRGDAGRWLRGVGPLTTASVASVLTPSPRTATTGYDIVIAAPRMVSILLAVGRNPEGVVDAHQRAVAATVSYLESRGVVVVSRGESQERDAAQWSKIVSFTHGINRAGEPHLHDHVLTGSLPLGAARVLERASLVAHATSADAFYKAVLRYEIRERTGEIVWRSFHGTDHVVGYDEGFRALWGGHHSERNDKTIWRRDDVVARWQRDIALFEPVAHLRPPTRSFEVLDEHTFAQMLWGRSSISRRDVMEGAAHGATFGCPGAVLEAFVDAVAPSVRHQRGLDAATTSARDIVAFDHVRERGPRPLSVSGLDAWRAGRRRPAEHKIDHLRERV